MGTETIVRHANYGLQLVDALTGLPVLGASRVSAELVDTPPSGTAANTEPFLATQGRWVFENLENQVNLRISADLYLEEHVTTGVDIPSVPASSVPGILVPVNLLPRVGYPFPSGVTRVVGAVRFDASVDPSRPLVPGASLTITPHYALDPVVSGGAVTTRTAGDGQYVMWFLPDVEQDPTLPVAVTVDATFTIGMQTYQGSLSEVPIGVRSTVYLEEIDLTPAP